MIPLPGKPYLILIGVGAWLVTLMGAGFWQHHAGAVAERVEWQAKDNAELAAANAKILDLTAKVLEQEHAFNERQNAAAVKYEEEKRRALDAKDHTIADLRAGTLRLRDPHATACNTSGSAAGSAATPSGERDGGAPGELSRETSEFLVGEAARADEIVFQLQACQAIVISDRAITDHDPPR